MNIGTVVEGPTDRLRLEAVLDHLLPEEHRYFSLQPTVTFGETGAGWKGVRRWCHESWQRDNSDLDLLLSEHTGPKVDLLVIHVDADIAAEEELLADKILGPGKLLQPCPPVSATVTQIEHLILHWLNRDALPGHVIFAIPAQDAETWTFAALFPEDTLCSHEDYECLHHGQDHPGYRLTLKQYGKILNHSSGKIKKPRHAYENILPHVIGSWDEACKICSQADAFSLAVHQMKIHQEENI
ncbi:MAG: hypothetical protein JXB35_13905 [Anaerolineae bacterium]|nr:hypothetical protein [Anaerolineae bacterium]